MARREELPEPERLLSESKYWTEKIFFRFLEHCDEISFRNPHEGLKVAAYAGALAEKVETTDARRIVLRMDARSIEGSAYRAIGDYDEADRAYRDAELIGNNLSDLDTADLKRRKAYLRAVQFREEEGLALINEAIQAFRLHGDISDRDFLGRCHLARGTIYRFLGDAKRAALDYSESLTHIDLKRSTIYYESAFHNLLIVLTIAFSPRDFSTVHRLLKKAERRIRYGENPLARNKLKWLKGLISTRFGSTREAVRFLTRARDALTELGCARDVILISLDLAEAYFAEARPAWELKAHAEETFTLCSSMSADVEALAALSIWRDAAVQEDFSKATTRKARETVLRLREVDM